MEQFEFKIDHLKGYDFRFCKISPVKMLALQTQINFKDMEQTERFFSFILENTEVRINDVWCKVKLNDAYTPFGIEDNIKALQDITTVFLERILKPVFLESNV